MKGKGGWGKEKKAEEGQQKGGVDGEREREGRRGREIRSMMCCAYRLLGMQQYSPHSRIMPYQPPGVEKPGSLCMCLSVCVCGCMCAFPH